MPAIAIDNLRKHYPHAEQDALQGVSLHIDSGEFVAITGRSGSGKSTLLNLIGALDRPTSGVVRYQDLDLATAADDRLADYRRVCVGFVFQAFFLSPYRTALENIMLALAFGDAPLASRLEEARAALRSVGLGDFMQRRVTELSGGQRQRVALARSMVLRPPLLLADEPVGSLDHATRDDVLNLLLQYRKDHGATLLIVTHEERVAELASRVIVLENGQLVSDASR